MNKKIKELALLSGFDIDSNVTFAEKTRLNCFADLIIKEALEQARLEEDRYYSLIADDCAMAMENYQVILKKHFEFGNNL